MKENNNQVNPVFAGMAYAALRNAMDLVAAKTPEEENNILEFLGLAGQEKCHVIEGLLVFVERAMRTDMFPALGLNLTTAEDDKKQ